MPAPDPSTAPGAHADQGLAPVRMQSLLAAVIGACLTGLAVWFLAVDGHRGGLVHHDAPPRATSRFTLNVNTASAVELAQLPGLGPTMAARLVEHRREHGPFTSIDGLLAVPGIGPATLDAMRPHLRTIRQPEASP